MNDKKYFYIMIFSLVLLLVLGVSYAWFNAVIKGKHPELKSRPNRPHPLFHGFIEAANKVNR